MSPEIKGDKNSKTPQILGKRNKHLFRLQLFLPRALSFSPPSSHSLGLHETERPMSEKGEFIWAHMSQLKRFLEEFACMFACVSLGRSVFLVWQTICHFLFTHQLKRHPVIAMSTQRSCGLSTTDARKQKNHFSL